MNKLDISRLVNPKCIAVIGASEAEGKAGAIIMKNLLRSSARLYPVNPKYETIFHIPTYNSVADLPCSPDIAVVTVAAALAVESAEQCAKKGTAFVIIVAGGFGETGSDGKQHELRLKQIAEKYNTRILGPNSLGIFIPDMDLDTIFVEHGDKALAAGGSIAFISQSGSVGVESLGLASNTGYGMKAFIGTGNKTDLSEMDFMPWFAEDPETNCIALYLESIEGGRNFLDTAEDITMDKPVVVLKAGRTAAGAAAAGSHTGRLAGSDSVINGALKQYGIQRAMDDEELCDSSKVLSMLNHAEGNRIAVVTSAGGFGVMCTDYVDTAGTRADLKMAKLAPETVERIKKKTFPFASCTNPIDFTASADNRMYVETLNALLDDKGVDIIICIALFSPPSITDELIEMIAEVVRKASKPILVFSEFGPYTEKNLLDFYRHGVAGFSSISRVVRAARFLVERGNILKQIKDCSDDCIDDGCLSENEIKAVFSGWKNSLRIPGKADEFEAKQLLKKAGLPVPADFLLQPDTPVESIPVSSFPAAVKLCSAEVIHKTDAGGVVLNVLQPEIESVIDEMRKKFPGENFLVTPMVKYTAPEVILGSLNDATFGPAVMAGAGGILTELYRDTSFRLAPCGKLTAESMLDELEIAPVLSGYRGSEMDKSALSSIISRMSVLASVVAEDGGHIDINPIVWTKQGWLVLDAKVVTAQ